MPAESYGLGDMVWSRINLINDGTIPDIAPEASLAPAGTRGVVVKVGHVDQQPDTPVYLVRFEEAGGVLGPPVGCVADELTQDEALATSLRSAGAASTATETNEK